MRIRRSASRLLGSAASASCTEPPRSERPPPPPAPPAPAPAHESRAGSVGPATSSGGEPCCELSRSPWDLMAQLDLSDPQVEKLFVETCFMSVSWRGSWLFPAGITMPAGSIKEEREDLAVDNMVDGIILKLRKAVKKMESKPKPNMGVKVKKGLWRCRKNDSKRWYCRRLVSEPNSYCSYHLDQKPLVSDKPRRKRPDIDLGEGFYYYAGFGPGTKRRRTSSSDSVLEPPLPAEPLKEEAPDEMQLDFSAGQVQAANESDHHVVLPPSVHIVDEPGISRAVTRRAGMLTCRNLHCLVHYRKRRHSPKCNLLLVQVRHKLMTQTIKKQRHQYVWSTSLRAMTAPLGSLAVMRRAAMTKRLAAMAINPAKSPRARGLSRRGGGSL